MVDVEPTWLATKTTRSSQLLTHGISGERTLCGLRVRAHRWYSLTDTELEMCRLCDPEAAPPATAKTVRSTHLTPRRTAIPAGWVAANDLRARTGITYRQMDYWIRAGLVQLAEPSNGMGHSRYVGPAEVQVVMVMAALVKAGVSPEAASRAARNGGELAPGVRVVIAEAAA